MIITVDTKKSLEKSLHPFFTKMLTHTKKRRFFLILGIYKTSAANIIFNGERLNTFPAK